MKKKSIIKLSTLLAISLAMVTSCKDKSAPHGVDENTYALEIDSSLKAILQHTNREVVSSVSTVKALAGPKLFSIELPGRINFNTKNRIGLSSRISGRIERLYVKYNHQKVKKGQLIMEVYSPELVAAQRELLMIAASHEDEKLLESSKRRLVLLGASHKQIEKLIHTKEVMNRFPVYSTASGYVIEDLPQRSSGVNGDPSTLTSKVPFLIREGQYVQSGQHLFTLYEDRNVVAEFSIPPSLSQEVHPGNSLLIQEKDLESVFKGEIVLVEPVLKNGERFSTARVYLAQPDLRVGQLVKAHLPIYIKEGSWLPQMAIWRSGTKSMVFKKEGSVFIPKEVKIGAVINGQVQVLEDVKDWDIASNANFLIDSESFIRPQ